MQLFLQKIIWLPRLSLQYTKLHTVTPPYLQYVPNQSSQIYIKLVTNNIEKINGSFLKHIIIIRSHYTTVDRNIKQAYAQS